MRRPIPLLALLVLPLIPACGREAVVEREVWRRDELARLPMVGVANSGGGSSAEVGEGFLGGEEVRDLSRVGPFQRENLPRVAAGRVRVIRQEAGSLASWRLELGAEPWLELRPLAPQGDCRPEMAVEVTDEEGDREAVWEAPAPAAAFPAPPLEVVDLGRWAGRAIRLTLRAEATGSPCTVQWASAAVVSRRPVAVATTTPERRPNLLLIAADTLRADALGAWGREPSVTPALDALASESDVFLGAYTAFNVTNPSFASMMTGLSGRSHGVYDLKTPLRPGATTLAEALQGAGYATFASLAVQHLRPAVSGLGQGFDEVAEAEGHRAGELAVDELLAWLDAPRDRPFFAWLHLFDPHTPHTPPQPFAEGLAPESPSGLRPVSAWTAFRDRGVPPFRQAALAAAAELYAGEVAYLDRQVDRVLGYLEDRGLGADTIVVFVADHGENLEDHGIEYRHAGLWETTTHVPLMIRWPQATAGRRIEALVATLDLFPTLLAAAGLEPPASEGHDLRTIADGERPGRRAVFFEHSDRLGRGVRTATHRYFVIAPESRIAVPGVYLYDLVEDPDETRNLAGTGDPEEARLADLLDRWQRSRPIEIPGSGAPDRPLSAEEERELRALGYL